jgi:hypothetical protein
VEESAKITNIARNLTRLTMMVKTKLRFQTIVGRDPENAIISNLAPIKELSLRFQKFGFREQEQKTIFFPSQCSV